MERLELYLTDLQRMLLELNQEIEMLKHVRSNPSQYAVNAIKRHRNSMIKDFEISYELFWKTLKAYLFAQHGIAINSPKGIFHQCEKVEFLSDDETKFLLRMADARNATTHDYGESMAEEMSRTIPAYYEIMNNIAKRIKT